MQDAHLPAIVVVFMYGRSQSLYNGLLTAGRLDFAVNRFINEVLQNGIYANGVVIYNVKLCFKSKRTFKLRVRKYYAGQKIIQFQSLDVCVEIDGMFSVWCSNCLHLILIERKIVSAFDILQKNVDAMIT